MPNNTIFFWQKKIEQPYYLKWLVSVIMSESSKSASHNLTHSILLEEKITADIKFQTFIDLEFAAVTFHRFPCLHQGEKKL